MHMYRQSLRNQNINYRSGMFFVTTQVSKNKSIFGTIVGQQVVLNSFGKQVLEYWHSLPQKYPELEIIETILMPNHFHSLVRINFRITNKEHHLSFLISRFKGGTGYIYGKLRKNHLIEDIGEHLWQLDFWDDLVSSDDEQESIINYIRKNPKNWSRDRYGACTGYSFGNLNLLNKPSIAFVASQGFSANMLKIRRAKALNSDEIKFASELVASASTSPIISTFTSSQEREILRRALSKNRSFIWVCPQGIQPKSTLPKAIVLACEEGRGLIISPQSEDSRLNKKIATWCNEYVIRHSQEIWVGDISPNGMLSTMLKAFNLTL